MSRSHSGISCAALFLCINLCFALQAEAAGGKERVLYGFSGGADGSDPANSLISDKAGSLYGTTSLGGAFGAGSVFELVNNRTG